MITDFGEDMHYQFLEILRILLDSQTMSGLEVSCISYLIVLLLYLLYWMVFDLNENLLPSN